MVISHIFIGIMGLIVGSFWDKINIDSIRGIAVVGLFGMWAILQFRMEEKKEKLNYSLEELRAAEGTGMLFGIFAGIMFWLLYDFSLEAMI